MTDQQPPAGFTPPPAQPGAPAAGYSVPAAPAGGSTAAAVAKNVGASIVKRVVIYVVVAVVVGGGYFAYRLLSGDPTVASVGQCMDDAAAAKQKTVPCDDPKATWKIVGKIEDKTESQWDGGKPCVEPFPTSEYSFWSGKSGRAGTILCAEPVKK